jgi:SAM-dependent methyltransferase
MSWKEQFYPESKFGGFTDIDGTMAFYNRINALVKDQFVILDVGCGTGSYFGISQKYKVNLRNFRGRVKKVIGIDVDPKSRDNPSLDEFQQIEDKTWPVNSQSIDLILSDNVLEHLQTPEDFFDECKRVLKPGGYLCLRTPNRRSYVGILARLIPNKYHARLASAVQENREPDDVFPTYYRCNTIQVLRKQMRSIGLDAVVYGYEAEPSYFHFSRFFYFLGVVYQRLVPGFLKSSIFAFGRMTSE